METANSKSGANALPSKQTELISYYHYLPYLGRDSNGMCCLFGFI